MKKTTRETEPTHKESKDSIFLVEICFVVRFNFLCCLRAQTDFCLLIHASTVGDPSAFTDYFLRCLCQVLIEGTGHQPKRIEAFCL